MVPVSHPLSHAQRALWFLHGLAPASGVYNTGVALAVRSAVDVRALRSAVAWTSERHVMLRCTFVESGGEPVRTSGALAPALLGIRELPGADPDEVRRSVRRELIAPFDLAAEGAFRFRLLRTRPDEAVLLIAGHHIGTDAVSNWILLRDTMHAYRAYADGTEPEPARALDSYDEYVAKEAARIDSPRGARMARHWHQVCEGASPARLPLDRSRPAGPAGSGSTYHIDLGADRLAPLREAAREAGVSLFAFLLGTFQGLLHRYTRQNHFLVGCPTSTRISPGARDAVGNYINTLLFRADFAPGATFRGAAEAAQEQVKNGMSALEYPFELVTRTVHRPRTGPGSALCRITFNLIGTANPDPLLQLLLDGEPDGARLEFAGLEIAPYELAQAEGQLDLAVSLRQSARSLSIDCRYDPELFDEATIESFAHLFVRALDTAAAGPDSRIARLPLWDPPGMPQSAAGDGAEVADAAGAGRA